MKKRINYNINKVDVKEYLKNVFRVIFLTSVYSLIVSLLVS
jgi:hypothetical protein